jgi:hypothetical protein
MKPWDTMVLRKSGDLNQLSPQRHNDQIAGWIWHRGTIGNHNERPPKRPSKLGIKHQSKLSMTPFSVSWLVPMQIIAVVSGTGCTMGGTKKENASAA